MLAYDVTCGCEGKNLHFQREIKARPFRGPILSTIKFGHSFIGNFIYCWKAYIGRKQVIIAEAKQPRGIS